MDTLLKVIQDGEWFHVVETGCGFSWANEVSERTDKEGNSFPVANGFADRATAVEQLRRLNKWLENGNTVSTKFISTYDRFEAKADKVYGPAW